MSSHKEIKNLASYLDLANHSPAATEKDIQKICAQVAKYGFNAAFMNPFYVPFAKESALCKKVGTIVSFPLGQESLAIKVASAQDYARNGADELDVSLNVALIKEGKWKESLHEMQAIVNEAHSIKNAIIVKFIPETGYLTPDEIKKIAELMVQAGADFFKTCSGLGPRGATFEDVKLVRAAIGDQIKIKVAGGIRTYEQAVAFIEAGANRIGTSSAVAIINKEQPSPKDSQKDSE